MYVDRPIWICAVWTVIKPEYREFHCSRFSWSYSYTKNSSSIGFIATNNNHHHSVFLTQYLVIETHAQDRVRAKRFRFLHDKIDCSPARSLKFFFVGHASSSDNVGDRCGNVAEKIRAEDDFCCDEASVGAHYLAVDGVCGNAEHILGLSVLFALTALHGLGPDEACGHRAAGVGGMFGEFASGRCGGGGEAPSKSRGARKVERVGGRKMKSEG